MRPGRRKLKRRPLERVAAADPDERLVELAQALVRSGGIPAELAEVMAEGFVCRLRRLCWASFSDILGDGDNVERLAGWRGPPRSLTSSLARLGFVLEVRGEYLCADAASEAPEYVKARWKRYARGGFQQVSQRRGERRAAGLPPAEPIAAADPWGEHDEDEMPLDTLFGPEPEPPEDRHVATPGFTRFRQYFSQAYAHRYAGRAYPWRRGADHKFVQRIVEALADVADIEPLIDAYLAARQPYFAGHPLHKLFGNLAEFLAKAADARKSAERIRRLGSASTTERGGIRIGGGGAGDVGGASGAAKPAP